MKINMTSTKLVLISFLLFSAPLIYAATVSESSESKLKQRSIWDWNAAANTISVNFKDLEICAFLDDLAKTTKINIRYRVDCKTKISHKFTDLPIQEALAKILRPYSYVIVADENTITRLSIYPVKNGESIVSNENTETEIPVVANEQYESFVKNNDAEIVAQLEGREIKLFPEEQQVIDSQINAGSDSTATDIEQESEQSQSQQIVKTGILEDEVERNSETNNSYQGSDADNE